MTEDELTRLRILAAYEIYQVLRNHQVDDVGRTCIDLAERAVKAFAEWAPGDKAKEEPTKGEIEWILQGDGVYGAVTPYGVFVLSEFTFKEGRYSLHGTDSMVDFKYDSLEEVQSHASAWIEETYGKA